MKWVIAGAAVVLLLLVLAGAIYWLLRLRMIAIIAVVEDTVDAMMDETFVHQQQMYQDTLSGRTQIKLKRLYEKMTLTAEQSQKQHQQTQTLISDISHQVKTPIANIKMLNETLNTQNLPVAKREQLNEQLTQQVDKLDTLVQDMMKASKLETGAVVLKPQVSPLLPTLSLAIVDIALKAEQKNIEIQIECEEELEVKHDQQWTREAFFNLLDNAVKYNVPNGVITITCERWEIYTRIAVADTGIGISEEEQAQIFQRFYRSAHAKDIDGVGIGLFLAREIIGKQSGYIKLKSEVGMGTTFEVFLLNS